MRAHLHTSRPRGGCLLIHGDQTEGHTCEQEMKVTSRHLMLLKSSFHSCPQWLQFDGLAACKYWGFDMAYEVERVRVHDDPARRATLFPMAGVSTGPVSPTVLCERIGLN